MITKENIGVCLKLKNGDVVIIEQYDIREDTYPVYVKIIAGNDLNRRLTFTPKGEYHVSAKSDYDIVELLNKEEFPEYYL